MREFVRKTKRKKQWSALLVVVATIAYLLLTSATAQDPITSVNGAKVAYQPDRLSYGDMYAFSQDVYNSSNYGLTNSRRSAKIYTSKSDKDNTAQNINIYKYYGKVTTGDHGDVSDAVAMVNHTYTEYHHGYSESTAPAALAGETVPTLTTSSTGVYTLVPYSTGTYRIYVYAQSDPSGHVWYDLIDSYTKANSYRGTPSQSLSFTNVEGTNYWYATVQVDTLTWSAHEISVMQSSDTANRATDDTNGGVTYTGEQKTNVTLGGSSYFYNVWTARELLYDTLLTLRWDSTVQLCPVSKYGDTITITNADATSGNMTVVNVFGEKIATGTAVTTAHAPVYITTTPTSEGVVFGGFGGASLDVIDAEQGIYCFHFESTAALTGSWLEKENLPTIAISGDHTGTMDFFAASTASTTATQGQDKSFTFTLDYSNAGDVTSVDYSAMANDSVVTSGNLTAEANSFTVSCKWYTTTVTLTAHSASGKSYTAIFTITVNNAGLIDVAQIGDTKYQFIEDALAAAASGDKIVVIQPQVSFVVSDTIPEKWSADGNGDGAPDGYTVKSGVVLVLPYSVGSSSNITAANDDYPYALYGESTAVTSALATDASYEYRKLIVPQGVTMYVKGNVATGGTISSAPGVAGGTNGSATETYSVIEVNGMLSVLDGGILSSCGYVTGSGQVVAQSGGKVYQPMVVCDFRGGSYTVAAAGMPYETKSGEGRTSPFQRYTMQNIQADFRLESGSMMYAYCDLYAGSAHNRTTASVVGNTASEDALIKLGPDSMLESSYDPTQYASPYPRVGKTTVTITGGGSYGNMSLTTSGATVNTSDLTFPIPYNYDFVLKQGTYNIPYSLALLPGARMTVWEDATLNITNNTKDTRFMVYDGLYDHTSTGASGNAINPPASVTVTYGKVVLPRYPKTDELQNSDFAGNGAANLVVNGELNIGTGVQFGGVVQTEGTGTLNMQEGTVLQCTTQVGVVGEGSVIIKRFNTAGATVRTLKAQVLDDATGQRLDIVSGLTYHGAENSGILQDYTYDLYTSSANPDLKETHTEALNAAVSGSWWNYTATIVMVDGSGAELSRNTAHFAHGANVSNYYLEASCTTPATTVISDNMTLYYKAVAQIGGVNYLTLASAVEAFDAGNQGDAETDADLPYIQLLADSNEPGFAIDKDVYLDLNGKTVTLEGGLTISEGATLYGMDSTTDGYEYDETYYGRIKGHVSGKVAVAHETYRLAGGKVRRYVSYQNGDELSFHRYNMSVTKYEFHFRPNGQCDMDFGATFRGSPTVVQLLKDMGFKVEKTGTADSAQGWWSTQNGGLPEDLASGYVLRGTLINIGTDQPKEFTQDYDIYALLKFQDDTEVESVPRNLNYLWALKQYYTSNANADEKSVINAFLDENNLRSAWDAIK